MSVVLGALIVLPAVASLVDWRWSRPHGARRTKSFRHPGFWLLVVSERDLPESGVVHDLADADVARRLIARYVPTGWFDLADDNPMIK
ncbi:hypothetical protein ACWDKQ_07790 [Saccharopolyspora sp. NPDC000995]